jgi:hypothetical protein
MATNENAHDKLFKSALANRDDAAMELRAVLPSALVRQIDFATLITRQFHRRAHVWLACRSAVLGAMCRSRHASLRAVRA